MGLAVAHIACNPISLFVGVLAASGFWVYFYLRFKAAAFDASTNVGTVTKVAVLEKLRAGQLADAISLQKMFLDGTSLQQGASCKTDECSAKTP